MLPAPFGILPVPPAPFHFSAHDQLRPTFCLEAISSYLSITLQGLSPDMYQFHIGKTSR